MYQTFYKKSECQTGIIHIGYGAFHRAHQAMYIDDYMEFTGDLRWGIVAVNLRNEGFREIDDYIVKTPSKMRMVRSHLDYIDWTKNRTVAKHMLTLPSVHLITITVTESGYTPGSPLYEYLACGLRNRNTPITIMCCDNIRQNGLVLEAQFLAYLYQTNQHSLADWVRENVSFPSCMVDRITPRSTQTFRNEIDKIYVGLGDTAVQTEEYTQWVIEDKFVSDFPDLTKVGATITGNIEPYEETKIRILNGAHTSLAYMGVLSGYHRFDQVMNDKMYRKHFRKLQKEEIVPSIDIELPFDIHEYVDTVEERLSSHLNHDELERICFDGYTKFHTFILPSLEKCLEKNKKPIHIYRSIAAWYLYARKFAKGCSKIKYNEPNWLLLEPLLADDKIDSFVTNERLWGDLAKTYITFSRDLKSVIMSQTFENEIDLLTQEY
jgi:D-arabinitol 4-dehydrogenase